MPDDWTIGRLLTWTTDYLARQGADSPRLDAEVLLAEARGCRRIELYTSFDHVTDERLRTAFRELVRRRAEGMPVAYLVGRREFYSLSFRVNPDVLIPRPETELLVVRLLDLAKAEAGHSANGAPAPLTIADVGTGSGVIAICAAKHLPSAKVTAIDISPAALAVAQKNAAAHHVESQIGWFESDLFAAVPAERRFGFIVSNPPYIRSNEMEDLPATVRDYEPRIALEAGPQGTSVIERLIPQAAQRLLAGGWLLMEISPQIEGRVHELIRQSGRFSPPATIKDLAGLARVVEAQRGD